MLDHGLEFSAEDVERSGVSGAQAGAGDSVDGTVVESCNVGGHTTQEKEGFHGD